MKPPTPLLSQYLELLDAPGTKIERADPPKWTSMGEDYDHWKVTGKDGHGFSVDTKLGWEPTKPGAIKFLKPLEAGLGPFESYENGARVNVEYWTKDKTGGDLTITAGTDSTRGVERPYNESFYFLDRGHINVGFDSNGKVIDVTRTDAGYQQSMPECFKQDQP